MSELQPTYDPDTLREIYPDPAAVRARVDELRREVAAAPDEVAELMARGELVERLCGLAELDAALTQASAAADRAELVGSAAQQHLARLRLAHVHQLRGEFAPADLFFVELLGAALAFGPVVEAITRLRAGGNDYDQGRYADAAEHFAAALALRERLELPAAEIEVARVSLAAARRREETG